MTPSPHEDELRRLGAYVDGELSPDERDQVERRLAEDPRFAVEAEMYRTLDSLAQRATAVAPPPNVSDDEWGAVLAVAMGERSPTTGVGAATATRPLRREDADTAIDDARAPAKVVPFPRQALWAVAAAALLVATVFVSTRLLGPGEPTSTETAQPAPAAPADASLPRTADRGDASPTELPAETPDDDEQPDEATDF